ncbi:MAG: hypothetical protein GC202_02125 [Alphaproteobacteria bacterium]|nr:hypothetical protein [Alphaproteobacteria bacterium]
MAAGAARGRASVLPEIDVEALLVWVYQKQQAHKVARTGLFDLESALAETSWRSVSGDGCYVVGQIQELGCRVDGGGYAHGDLAPDAETVHEAVRRLTALEAGLLVYHGATISRPDWLPGATPKLGPKMDRGKPVVLWDKHRNYGNCPIKWELSAETIQMQRFVYATWRQGMEKLVGMVKTNLVSHRVTGPAVQAGPWVA